MNESILPALKIAFLFGFTLHNLEEAIWLPGWSRFAGRFRQPVSRRRFIFAVTVVTVVGYGLTAAEFLAGGSSPALHYIYLGFIGMMGVNAILPHLLATVVLKRYMPGLATGLVLNLPLSAFIIYESVRRGADPLIVLAAVIINSGITVLLLRMLFEQGTQVHVGRGEQ